MAIYVYIYIDICHWWTPSGCSIVQGCSCYTLQLWWFQGHNQKGWGMQSCWRSHQRKHCYASDSARCCGPIRSGYCCQLQVDCVMGHSKRRCYRFEHRHLHLVYMLLDIMPICKCCWICKARAPRQTQFNQKLVCAILFLGLLVGIVLSAVLAYQEYNQAKDGFENMRCTSSLPLNAKVSGKTLPGFIGILPLLIVFGDLDETLNTNSQSLNNLIGTSTRMQSINDAVIVASRS